MRYEEIINEKKERGDEIFTMTFKRRCGLWRNSAGF